MKVGKREKGKIYAYRYRVKSWDQIMLFKGQSTSASVIESYPIWSRFYNIKLKPGQTIEIEVRAKGGVE